MTPAQPGWRESCLLTALPRGENLVGARMDRTRGTGVNAPRYPCRAELSMNRGESATQSNYSREQRLLDRGEVGELAPDGAVEQVPGPPYRPVAACPGDELADVTLFG